MNGSVGWHLDKSLEMTSDGRSCKKKEGEIRSGELAANESKTACMQHWREFEWF